MTASKEIKGLIFPILCLICLFCFTKTKTAQAVIIDKIVAVVNVEMITLSDVLKSEGILSSKGYTSIPNTTPLLNKEVLDKIIEKKILLQLANEKNAQVPEEQLQAAINDIIEQYGAENMTQLAEELKQQGLSIEGLRQEIEDKIKIAKLVNIEVRSKIMITNSELDEYYKQHIDEYEKKEKINASHILLPLSQEIAKQEKTKVKQQAEEIINWLRQQPKNTADPSTKFEVSWSDLGYIKRGDLMAELEKAIWELKVGEIVLVRTQLGYHIVQITDRKIPSLENDPKVKEEIEEIIRQKKTNKRLEAWLNELRDKATIDIMP